MGLFKKKDDNIEYYETEMSLPGFSIDTNGFIMFDDRTLGGSAVMEIIPHVTTEGMTHADPVYRDESTDFNENPGYESSTGALFPDVRSSVYPGWVYFLNGLLPLGPEDEPTHIQILAKKCRTPEWKTRIDYACYSAHEELDHVVRTPGKSVLKTRTADYLGLLDGMKKEVDELPAYMFDVRRLPAYKTRFFLVVSYTPSSEGWWMDGRDSDYYIRDSASPLSLFKEDRSVDRVVSLISRFQKDDTQQDSLQEDDFFWIETDRTAQILDTRTKKIRKLVESWNKREPARPMPFHLKAMDGREVAALIRFFPNILTPYWNKIWNLHSNQDDVLFRADALHAIDMWDTSFIEGRSSLNADITSGTVDMRHTKEQQDAFLSKYRGVDFEEIAGLRSERDELNWSPEEEERRAAIEAERARMAEEDHDLWGDIGDTFAIADEYKTPEQRRADFLQKYKNRSVGAMDIGTKKDDDPHSLFGN